MSVAFMCIKRGIRREALMKKGLRHAIDTINCHFKHSERSPDEEGIKTLRQTAALPIHHDSERSPDEEGIKTVPDGHRQPPRRIRREALMKKGLRRSPSPGSTSRRIRREALMKKGLRRMSLPV